MDLNICYLESFTNWTSITESLYGVNYKLDSIVNCKKVYWYNSRKYVHHDVSKSLCVLREISELKNNLY